jgi:kynurenine formamidase
LQIMASFIDLTLPLENGMRGVQLDVAKSAATDGWNATTLTLYSHCGTHMDAPRHFLDDGTGIEQTSLEACIGPATLIDLTPVQPRELITPARLGPAAEHVSAGDRILLRTDWSHRHGTDSWRDELPRIDVALARWFVERQVQLIGVEPPSVADVNNREELTTVHRILLEAGIVIVEGLTNLDQLTEKNFTFIVLPLRVPGCDGAPVRAVAVEE